ncbi:hypothetical protein NPIL_503451 [Nephila pilipes]|uniref:Uncharacterized protein n=1 Tax=Nephila pilipes TaxID=299642 RepID=A0A8X6NXN9_NEPPI|nr:hypothetical protein NPIL_503451 [Nephila pilipes]
MDQSRRRRSLRIRPWLGDPDQKVIIRNIVVSAFKKKKNLERCTGSDARAIRGVEFRIVIASRWPTFTPRHWGFFGVTLRKGGSLRILLAAYESAFAIEYRKFSS